VNQINQNWSSQHRFSEWNRKVNQ